MHQRPYDRRWLFVKKPFYSSSVDFKITRKLEQFSILSHVLETLSTLKKKNRAKILKWKNKMPWSRDIASSFVVSVCLDDKERVLSNW